jgi:BrnA antitoxin of type II toxin-antitoxin system
MRLFEWDEDKRAANRLKHGLDLLTGAELFAGVERLADEEGGLLPAGWESTIEIRIPESKQAVHIRLDKGVLSWFKAHPGYQTRINAVLRAFVAARRRAEPEP